MTEDMCVTHFLIQPDPEGVKLQGWNERAFSECVHVCVCECECVGELVHVCVWVLVECVYVCVCV